MHKKKTKKLYANKFLNLFIYFNRKFINKLSNKEICQHDCPMKLNFTVREQTYLVFLNILPKFLNKSFTSDRNPVPRILL